MAEKKVIITTWSYWKSESGIIGDASVASENFIK